MDIPIGITFCFSITVILSALLYLFLSKYSIKDSSFDENKAKKRNMIKKHNEDFRTLQDKTKDKKSKKQKKIQKVQHSSDAIVSSHESVEEIQAPEKMVEDTVKVEKISKPQPKTASISKKDKSKKGPSTDKLGGVAKVVSVTENDQQQVESGPVAKKAEKESKKSTQNEKESKNTAQKPVPESKAVPLKETVVPQSNDIANISLEPAKIDAPKPIKEQIEKLNKVSLSSNVVKHPNKKKRSEVIGIQQIGSSKEAITMNILVPLIQKAELSKSEIQLLIDALLNKHQEDIAEWLSGRQDPLVKLKKQLSEKEMALKDEQEVTSGLQIKLKELRTELNAEKSIIRKFEENINSKQAEINALNAKLVSMKEESQAISLQNQQLQKQLNDERVSAIKLKEEQVIQQKFNHDKHLETVALQSQVNQLDAQLQEQQSINASMAAEMQRLQESLRIQENYHSMNAQFGVQGLQNQVSALEKKLQDIKNEKEELTSLISKQNTDIRNYHNDNERLVMEATNLKRKNEDNRLEKEKHVKHIAALEGEVQKLNECLALSVQNSNAHHNRDNYNPLINDPMENGDCHDNADKKKRLDELNERINSLTEEVHKKDVIIEELKKEIILKDSDSVNKQIKLDEIMSQNNSLINSLELQNKAVSQLQITLKEKEEEKINIQREIAASREKINELENKNWRASEVLLNSEKSLEQLKSQLLSVTESKERLENKEASQEKLQVDEFLNNLISNTLSNECEENIQILLKHLEEAILFVRNNKGTSISQLESKNTQLESLVSYYKTIISDTEGMLNSLQLHVEVEESRWKEKIQLLEDELSRLKK